MSISQIILDIKTPSGPEILIWNVIQYLGRNRNPYACMQIYIYIYIYIYRYKTSKHCSVHMIRIQSEYLKTPNILNVRNIDIYNFHEEPILK